MPRADGFSLLELVVVLAIGTFITAVVTTQRLVEDAESALAQGMAQYLMQIRDGVVEYQRQFFNELANGSAVTGTAVSTAPTVTELKNLHLLASVVPDTGPLGLVAGVRITATDCPGTACTLSALVHTPGPLQVPRTGHLERYDLANVAVAAMAGAGGMSQPGDTTRIRGLAFALPNPVAGQPGAVVGVTAFLNTAAYNRFVRINDTRDPALLGNLSAQGNLSITGSSTLLGTTTLGSTLSVAGAAAFNADLFAQGPVLSASSVSTGDPACQRVRLQADGQVIARPDCSGARETVIDATTGQVVTRQGGIDRVQSAVSGTASFSLRDASNALRTRLLDNGQVQTYDSSGVLRAVLDGATGRGSVQAVNFTASHAAGAACATANDLVADNAANGTVLMCRNGVWTPTGLPQATAGTACTTTGALGQDASGVGLLCRGGRWQNMHDRISRSVLMARYLVTDGTAIPKPDCPAGSVASVVLIPNEAGADYANAPPRNRFTAAAIDAGASWTAFLRLSDGSGNSFANSWGGAAYNFQAIANCFCDFSS